MAASDLCAEARHCGSSGAALVVLVRCSGGALPHRARALLRAAAGEIAHGGCEEPPQRSPTARFAPPQELMDFATALLPQSLVLDASDTENPANGCGFRV